MIKHSCLEFSKSYISILYCKSISYKITKFFRNIKVGTTCKIQNAEKYSILQVAYISTINLNIISCVHFHYKFQLEVFTIFNLRKLFLNPAIEHGGYEFGYLNIKYKFSDLKYWCQTPWNFQGVYALWYYGILRQKPHFVKQDGISLYRASKWPVFQYHFFNTKNSLLHFSWRFCRNLTNFLL